MMGEALPFDSVLIAGRAHSLEEFLELPLPERIRHIVGGTLAFTLAGRPVDPRESLAALRRVLSAAG